ncbi:MAG TPA: phosphatase PAP2 family protein [Solirubrobacteraceae bacterium]|nr:phosphatase PAP2 family protein [Solirubrobacteraceae bacterium]
MSSLRSRLAAVVAALALAPLLAGCGGSDGGDEARGAEPSAGTWKPWVLSSAGDIRVPPPPASESQAGRRDVSRREAAIRGRTAEQAALARRYSAAPVVEPWLEQTMELVARRPKDPPGSSRSYSYLAAAMHDAVIAAYHWKYEYDRAVPDGESIVERSPDPSYPSEHAAIAGAASRLIAHLYPEYPQARLEERAEDVAQARVAAGANHPSDVAAGLRLGRAIAGRYIEKARDDGSTRKWDGKRPRGPQHWEPPPGSTGQPIQPLAGTWRTWVLDPVDRFQPPAPPSYGTKAFIANARDVMRVKAELTPERKRLAKFWEAGPGTALPAGLWNRVALAYVSKKDVSVPRQTRLFAMLNVAMADAGAAAWHAKYQTGWWDPRPINAIRDLGLDESWEPYLDTPLFPAYPSGTSNYSGAAGEVLARAFPADAGMWRGRAIEAGMSRLWGGVHWRIDVEQGLKMGRKVAHLVLERAERDGAEA